jgi:hypothetical protein
MVSVRKSGSPFVSAVRFAMSVPRAGMKLCPQRKHIQLFKPPGPGYRLTMKHDGFPLRINSFTPIRFTREIKLYTRITRVSCFDKFKLGEINRQPKADAFALA